MDRDKELFNAKVTGFFAGVTWTLLVVTWLALATIFLRG